jgi:Ca-activated chloride channel family protein
MAGFDRRIGIAAGIVVVGALALMVLFPKVWLTNGQRADRLMTAEAYAQAAELYEDSMRTGIALYRAGRFEAAAAVFARRDEPDAAFNRGNALILLGRYDEAIASYDRALQLHPELSLATENRAIAIARRDQLGPPEDDAGGTGGQLEADEIVFDDRAKGSSEEQAVEADGEDALSDAHLRELWLRRVQTRPADFLRAKFAYQLSRGTNEAEE